MRTLTLVALACAACFAHAEEEKNFGLDTSAQGDQQPYRHQGEVSVVPTSPQSINPLNPQPTTGQLDADLKINTATLLLAPWFRAGNWEFGASAPYEKITTSGHLTYSGPAGYTVLPGPNGQPRLVFLQPGQSKPANSDVEGWADISLQGKRWLALNDTWQGYGGAVVKLANGDRNEGLGTGAVDYSAELGLIGTFPHAGVGLSAGHTWVGQPDNAPQLKDVDYATADAHLMPAEPITLGVSYDWRPTPWPKSADQRYGTLYAELAMSKAAHLRAYYKHYDEAPAGLKDAAGASFSWGF